MWGRAETGAGDSSCVQEDSPRSWKLPTRGRTVNDGSSSQFTSTMSTPSFTRPREARSHWSASRRTEDALRQPWTEAPASHHQSKLPLPLHRDPSGKHRLHVTNNQSFISTIIHLFCILRWRGVRGTQFMNLCKPRNSTAAESRNYHPENITRHEPRRGRARGEENLPRPATGGKDSRSDPQMSSG